MQIGDLIRVCHFDYNLNGMVGILMRIGKGYGDLKMADAINRLTAGAHGALRWVDY